MKQRLRKIYWTGISVTLLMALSAIAMAARLKISDTRNYLAAMLETASEWTLDSNEDLQSLADSIAGAAPPLRVMFLTDTGIVLADSLDGNGPGVVHYDDTEIITAKEGRTGSHFRLSEGRTAYMIYAAKRISPQLLLRLSYPVFEIAKLVMIYGSMLLLLFLILYFFQRRRIAGYSADQQRQMDDVRKLLEGEISHVDAVFPEYQPSLDAISYRTKRLREDHEEIMRTMDLRSDFIANASHELRSPLTSIRGYAEMLDEGLADTPEERALCLSMIRSESERMLSVINDILLLSKMENGTENEVPWNSAAQAASEVVRALAPEASAKEIVISFSGDTRIHAQEREIWEILFNLTDNAVRYGRKGGHVQILMKPHEIEVKDDGIGISEKNIGRVFEPFYRVEDRVENRVSGTGLGLSIVKTIVERRGGTIAVESVYEEGSRFVMTFPEEETM